MKTKWKTPTDEDAKLRPCVECKDVGLRKWHGGYTLIAVRSELRFPFVTVSPGYDDEYGHIFPHVVCFTQCRMEVQ